MTTPELIEEAFDLAGDLSIILIRLQKRFPDPDIVKQLKIHDGQLRPLLEYLEDLTLQEEE